MLKTKKYDEEHEIHFAKSLEKLLKIDDPIVEKYIKHKLVILTKRSIDQILCFSNCKNRTKRNNGIRSVLCL